ncbi:MAG: 2-oxo acid dehydrogenase subunit E2 [Deltaproteobacteria bacterium]|nr:2-oxo acid dehydrogenase subunit E2 [Deltaproteobacteria bacterium]
MATIIGLPKLSPTMEEGVLARWSKKEGDTIAPGEVIAEVETDKANMDFVLEEEGTLLKHLVAEGDTVKLGAPVAILGKPGEDVTALLEPATPAADRPSKAEAEEPMASAPLEPRTKGTYGPSAHAAAAGTAARVLASPLAKTLAAEHGIDLRSLRGTGPGGRVVERDVRAKVLPQGGTAIEPAFTSTPTSSDVEASDRPLSQMRKTIARRLVSAKQSVPHFYLTSDCDAAPLTAFRAAMNEIAASDQKISVGDLLVKAAALTLRRVPEVNASFLEDRIRFHGRVHVGVAVALGDGLVTVAVRDADRKGLAVISKEMRDLAARARARKLTPEEMAGSTFTLSNLGMYGIDHFQAIINPPEAAILAVGAVKRQPVVDADGRVVAGQRMALTLSCDHRVIDGATGARFLSELTRLLSHPAGLAL